MLGIHRNSSHVGVQGLLCTPREKYLILRGRQTITVEKCSLCKRFIAKPFVVESLPLPVDRVQDSKLLALILPDSYFSEAVGKFEHCLCTEQCIQNLPFYSGLPVSTFFTQIGLLDLKYFKMKKYLVKKSENHSKQNRFW